MVVGAIMVKTEDAADGENGSDGDYEGDNWRCWCFGYSVLGKKNSQ